MDVFGKGESVMKSIQGDNRGLTLLELLVGIVILAIITVPLLHTFVVGAQTEYKTQKYMEATEAAQNLCEQIQSHDADFVLSNCAAIDSNAHFYTKNADVYSVYSYTDPDDHSVTTTKAPKQTDFPTYYIGIPNFSYGSSTYDALITLDVKDDSGNQLPANSKEVVVGNQMDALINMTEADADAYDAFLAECGDLGETLSTDDLNRSIDINVERTLDSVTDTYKITAYFYYWAYIEYTDEDDKQADYYFTCAEQSAATVSSVIESDNGNPAFAVFLFYDAYAYYKSASMSETISINNPTEYPDINFFIINTNEAVAPVGYKAIIWYKYQNFDEDEDEPINSLVFTNLTDNGANQVEYRAARDELYKRTLPVTEYLAETKLLNRKFSVKVSLFEQGSDFTGTPIAEIDSTRINY